MQLQVMRSNLIAELPSVAGRTFYHPLVLAAMLCTTLHYQPIAYCIGLIIIQH